MERISKDTEVTEKQLFNLNIKTDKDDCLGIMWEPTTLECCRCFMSDYCSLLVGKDVLNKRRTLVENFIDEVDFSSIDESEVVDLLKSKVDMDTIVDAIVKLSNCKSKTLVIQFLDKIKYKYKL